MRAADWLARATPALRGCTSRFFASSMAFAEHGAARLCPVPLGLTSRRCRIHVMLRTAVLHSVLRRILRLSTPGRPGALGACTAWRALALITTGLAPPSRRCQGKLMHLLSIPYIGSGLWIISVYEVKAVIKTISWLFCKMPQQIPVLPYFAREDLLILFRPLCFCSFAILQIDIACHH